MARPDPALVAPPDSRWRTALVEAGPLAVLLWIAAVGAALWLAVRWLDPTPDKRLVIATGPEQGAYAEFAKRYLPLLQAQGLTVELRATQGSAENLALLRASDGAVHAGFVQGGVGPAGDAPARDAPDTSDTPGDPTAAAGAAGPAGQDLPVLSLGSVAIEPLWLFYRESVADQRLGRRPLTRLRQLDGWRVHTGPEGGGTRPLFEQLLAANDLTAGRVRLQAGATVQGVVELVQGRIDALVMVSAADAPLLQYLLVTPGVRLLHFDQAAAYTRRLPFLREVTLPRGLVDLAGDRPAQDVPLVAATTSLLARADLHPALAQLLVQAARDAHGEAGWFHRVGEFPGPQAAGWPLAPEAERFYRDGRPWLQRYLPFWLANFIDRMWIVLLPLLAALVPLSRVLPPLVALRLRSRVFRWYAHLRAVEHAIERPDADLPALRAQLERIDRQVEHIGLPLSYTNELYQLRSHIHLVRRRLAALAGDEAPTPAPTPTPAARSPAEDRS
jgi:TRAP-type uncharacterized transport system substrate-binding protein